MKKIGESGLIEPADRIVVGLSGGIDSVVLLDILAGLADKQALSLYIAHVNYGLRGRESDGDERFVKSLGKRYGYRVYVAHPLSPLGPARLRGSGGGEGKGEGGPENIQNSARNFRYKFFADTAKKVGANKIALAHHADDQAETLLLHLIRGSGLSGLVGMSERRDFNRGHAPYPPREWKDPLPRWVRCMSTVKLEIIRPLIWFTKKEIEAYAKEEGIKFVEDSTNKTNKYRRNVIRNDILPLLQKYNPNIISHICKTAAILRDEDDALNSAIVRLFNDSMVSLPSHHRTPPLTRWRAGIAPSNEFVFNRRSFLKHHIAIQRRLLRLAYAKLAGSTTDLLTDHIERMLQIIGSPKKEGRYSLPRRVVFIRKKTKCILMLSEKTK